MLAESDLVTCAQAIVVIAHEVTQGYLYMALGSF